MTGLMSALFGNWRVIGIAFLAGLVAGGGSVWWLRDQMAAGSQVQAARVVIRTIQGQERVTTRVVTRYITVRERTRAATANTQRSVPDVLPPSTDQRYSLPIGLLRLYNASGQGVDLSAVPDPAGRADDEASGVLPSTFAGVFIDNNGTCAEDRAQLVALQEWVKEQQRLARSP